MVVGVLTVVGLSLAKTIPKSIGQQRTLLVGSPNPLLQRSSHGGV